MRLPFRSRSTAIAVSEITGTSSLAPLHRAPHSFNQLPIELIQQIVKHVDAVDRIALRRTCLTLRHILGDSSLDAIPIEEHRKQLRALLRVKRYLRLYEELNLASDDPRILCFGCLEPRAIGSFFSQTPSQQQIQERYCKRHGILDLPGIPPLTWPDLRQCITYSADGLTARLWGEVLGPVLFLSGWSITHLNLDRAHRHRWHAYTRLEYDFADDENTAGARTDNALDKLLHRLVHIAPQHLCPHIPSNSPFILNLARNLPQLGNRTPTDSCIRSPYATCKKCQTHFWFEERVHRKAVTLVVRKDLGMLDMEDSLQSKQWGMHAVSPTTPRVRVPFSGRWVVRKLPWHERSELEGSGDDFELPSRCLNRKTEWPFWRRG